ncbi:MAG: VOC family protein, partial [Gaiellaceae bacterium]
MAVKPIPEGYRTVTPYLALDDAAQAIDYYKKAFGAKERGRM